MSAKRALSVLAMFTIAAPVAAQDASDFPVTRPDLPPPPAPPPPPANAKPSRLVPAPSSSTFSAPPMVRSMPTPIDAAAPEVIPPAVSSDRIVELSQLCTNIAPTVSELNANLLYENSWAYTRPRPYSSGMLKGDLVEYSRAKDSETIALIDFERFALCRVIVRAETAEQIDAVRSQLRSSLAAELLSKANADPQFKQAVLARKPADDHDNILISNTHSFELSQRTVDLTGMNVVGPDTLFMLMVEIAPLPPQYRR